MNQYTSNTLIRISVVIQTADGTAIDPGALTFKVKKPDGTIEDKSADIVHDSTGHDHVDYLPVDNGTYTYQWVGTGAAQVAKQGKFIVTPDTF
jgi:uncharacterized protein YfaS (alpha-2-macroglobulin family)